MIYSDENDTMDDNTFEYKVVKDIIPSPFKEENSIHRGYYDVEMNDNSENLFSSRSKALAYSVEFNKQGKKDGNAYLFSVDGKMLRFSTYKNGLKVLHEEYYGNGMLRSFEEVDALTGEKCTLKFSPIGEIISSDDKSTEESPSTERVEIDDLIKKERVETPSFFLKKKFNILLKKFLFWRKQT